MSSVVRSLDCLSQIPAPNPRSNLVVVEDDPALLELLTEILIEEGYGVAAVQDWRQAYPTVQAELPDLVLLDLLAGGEATGWQVLDRLIADPLTRDIPVILITAAGEAIEERRPALVPQYSVSVLLKPFDLDALCSTVASLLLPRRAPIPLLSRV